MKKLLIFGDSFGEERNGSLKYLVSNYNLSPEIVERHNSFKTYHSYLKDSNLYSEINNYSQDACSLWYQFSLFKKHYTGEEDVLFFITKPGRLYVNKLGHVSSLENATKKLNDLKKYSSQRNLLVEKILDGVINYFMYVQNSEQEAYLQHLLVRDIIRICPNVHIIPCFEDSVPKDIMDQGELWNVFRLETFHWGFKSYLDLHTKYWDIRCNHMTEENHEIFGKKLVDALRNKTLIDLNINSFVKPKAEDLEKYLIKK